jgi:stage II sporulation protein AA (anti-sigma F factor antagonist)
MDCQLVGNSLVVRLSGELDLVVAAEFKRVVDDLLDRRKARNLYVNLERVSFLDSSFLGALLGRYKSIHQLGGRMGIIRPQPAIRPTLELSGVFRTMQEFGSEPEALSAG